MVDVEIIKHLVELMVENDLAEVSIRDGEEEILLKKTPPPQPVNPPVSVVAAPPPAALVPASAAVEAPPAVQEEPDPDAGLTPILSPMVGTFYTASDPSASPYVKVGDTVTPDTVVCIIEAMKVFNEIKAGVAGRIERILVANETAVEFDQPLFMARPT
ncbi:MAG: acetyl-CoA carboxylase biotin carboxyl carrier protein [Phycisphaerae bacterium]|nr:acetyl-CoA carboxylase biotin carboxyl carrier protein [Phycisphaerae bacterium]